MTNFLSIRVSILLLLTGFGSIIFAKKTQLSPSFHRIPSDSFFVLSVQAQTLLKKSNILESSSWKPILEQFRLSNPSLQDSLDDPRDSGLNLNDPIRLFIRLQGNPFPTPVWGILVSLKNPQKADSTLSEIGENFSLVPKGGKNLRLGNPKLPFEIGRNGKLAYAIGILPNPRNPPSSDYELQLDQLIQEFFRKTKNMTFPESLKSHFSQEAQSSLYLEGTGVSRLFEDFFVQENLKRFLPMLDYLTHRPWGVHFNSRNGMIEFSILDYSELYPESKDLSENNSSKKVWNVLKKIPGDVPFVGNLNFSGDSFQTSTTQILEKALNFLTGGNFDSSNKLPGFDASLPELINSLNGNFVFGGGELIRKAGNQQTKDFSLFGGYKSSFFLGAEIGNPLSMKQLLAGIRSSQALMAWFDSQGIRFIEKNDTLWISTNAYRKELASERTIYPMPEVRKEKLKRDKFSLDLNISSFTQSARKESGFSFNEHQRLQLLDHFTRFRIFTRPKAVHGKLFLKDKTKDGLSVVTELIGQEIVERKNESLYRAISQNNFDGLVKAVGQGALINANDRFGHTPLHYSAFKGNTRFLDYLLQNGGDPNARGKHLSTPLHSAAWGRNMEVFELLLEDGADVDARTDEGETPCMTAALRGEKEMLEVLFALSADPHAVDSHGSNLIDLAAAGGHSEIVKLLSEMGVQENNPLHVAAGTGNLLRLKQLLKDGHKVNTRDGFGATPLLIAIVSGNMEVVQFLLSKGADPMIEAKDGYTLMHGAAFSGSKQMVRLALSFGLEINPRYGKDGITPVDVAEDEKEALPYLRSFGGKASWELPLLIP